MAANYNRPKPIDPIWYRRSCVLRITCPCGRHEKIQLGEFARTRGIPEKTLLYEMIARLRCRQCRRRPYADVVRGPY